MINQAVILAGGLGTRLSSAHPDKPKFLVPIGNSALADIIFEELAKAKIDRK